MDTRTRLAAVVILAALAIAIIVAVVTGSAHAGSPPLVERDALGRRTGTIETRLDGGAVVRDPQERRRRLSSHLQNGWVRREPNGRRLGAIERDR